MKVCGEMIRGMIEVVSKVIVGVMYFINDDVYEGQFKNDKESGDGIISYYILGIYTYSNGDKYEGQLRNGMKHGNGNSL